MLKNFDDYIYLIFFFYFILLSKLFLNTKIKGNIEANKKKYMFI